MRPLVSATKLHGDRNVLMSSLIHSGTGTPYRVLPGEANYKKVVSTGNALYVGFDVYSNFFDLKKGEIFTKASGAKKGGHAVTLVGYGVKDGVKYWTIQNSWGADWCDNGFAKFKRGVNLAGIEDDGYLLSASVAGGKTPPCFEGASTGLNAGGGEIPCSQAKNGPFGDLCADPSWGSSVRPNCPVICGACPAASPDDGSAPAPAPPAPTPPPPAPEKPAPAPAPPAGSCVDSEDYRDPAFHESCNDWSQFVCDGFKFSDELKENCPVACRLCKPKKGDCVDSEDYRDPAFHESCKQWSQFVCDGFKFSDELKKKCPVSCRVCR